MTEKISSSVDCGAKSQIGAQAFLESNLTVRSPNSTSSFTYERSETIFYMELKISRSLFFNKAKMSAKFYVYA